MSMLSNLDLIRRVPLFSMLHARAAQAIADSGRRSAASAAASCMVEQGARANALFILLNGRARVLTSDQRGREVILAVLEAGDYVGEMSLIDNELHSATVRAEVPDRRAGAGAAPTSRAACPSTPAGLRHACAAWCSGCAMPTGRSSSLALLDVYGRVARTLLDMAEDDRRQRQIIRHKCRARTWPRWWAPRARWSAAS
jgi:hypothetical protein